MFRSGLNKGVAREIDSNTGPGTFSLFLPTPLDLTIGDQFDIYPGCKKRWEEDCALRFDNSINFQGEPFVPGDDEAYRSADTKR
ncbi:unnamed protein product [marine sediment metagenome]|uniref:Bacteriophage phiJL001 Gp84 C-terminal domain-containing protein n=1 Tax=marine sediment metagenome TaxID=412755 RepID=X0WQ11_9ZZZZ